MRGLFIFLFILSPLLARAQDLEPALTLDLRNGLKQNTVTSICQDQLGRIWFGTSGSLHSFNGYEVNSYSGIDSRVISLITRGDKVICMTIKGVHIVDIHTKKIKSTRFKETSFYSIVEQEKYIKVYGEDRRLVYSIDEGNTLRAHKNSTELRDSGVFRIEFSTGALVSSIEGVHFKGKTSRKITSTYSPCYLKVGKDRCLLGTSDGIVDFGINRERKYLKGTSVEAIFFDAAGNLWLGTTTRGLLKISNLSFQSDFYSLKTKQGQPQTCWGTVTITGDRYALSSEGIKALSTVSVDGRNLINATRNIPVTASISKANFTLIGTANKGLFVYRNGHMRSIHYNPNFTLDNTVMQIIENDEGFLAITKRSFLQIDRDGNFLRRISYKSRNIYGYIMHIRSTSSGYMASATYGLLILDKELKIENTLKSQKGRIFSMSTRHKGNTYISSMDGGLFMLKNDSLIQIPIAEKQLYTVKSIGERMWISGATRLFEFRNGNFWEYGYDNGVPIREFNQGGLQVDSTRVWFAGVGGVVNLNSKIPINNNTLSSVLINEGRFKTKTIEFKYSEGLANIRLEPINTGDQTNHKSEYYYKNRWRELSKETHLTFKLKVGKNILAYRLRNLATGETVKTEYVLLRATPFWNKPWFYILCLFLLVALVVSVSVFVRFLRTKRLLRKEQKDKKVKEERLRISRELHDNIGARLTYIISSLEMDQGKEASGKTEKISSFARETMRQLRETIWAVGNKEVSLSEFVERARQFVDQANEMSASNVALVDNVSLDFALSPIQTINFYRIIQEALNNAVKYAEAKNITVEFKQVEKQVSLLIKDDGKGFDSKKVRFQSGVKNMRQRAEEAGAQFELKSAAGNGTRVEVRFEKK